MFLGVIQPKTIVLGPKERYIEKGSTINLTCLIQVENSSLSNWEEDILYSIRRVHST